MLLLLFPLALSLPQPSAARDALLDDLATAYRVSGASGAEYIVLQGIGVEHRSAEVQGHASDRQSVARAETWLGVAPAARTVLFEYRIGRHDGSERWRRRVIRGDSSMTWDFHDTFYSGGANPTVDLTRRRLARMLPHAVVHEASMGGVRVERRPAERFGDRPVTVLRTTFAGEATPIDLLVDEARRQLLAIRYAIEFPGIGATTAQQEFLGQRAHADLGWVPTRIITRLDTAVYRELGIVRAERSRALMDSIIATGAATASAATIRRPPRDTIITVAPRTHVLRNVGGRYNVFIVEQADGLFVAEAPAIHPSLDEWPTAPLEDVDALSRAAIEIISRRFPGVPIRRLMPTHFHSDHAAGLGAFVDAGARVVAHASDSAYYARLLARRGAGAAARSAAFDIVRDSARFGSGDDAIVVHTVAHGVHAAANLFAWLPARQVLFQGDLFYVDADGTSPPSRRGVMREFVAFLDARGIAPALMWGMHGNVPATAVHLAAVRR